MRNLHCITLFALVLNFFALVLHILHSFLSQSESSNFFMCIIIIIIKEDTEVNERNTIEKKKAGKRDRNDDVKARKF